MAASVDIFGTSKFGMLVLARGSSGSGLIRLGNLGSDSGNSKTVMINSANVGDRVSIDPVDALGDKHVLDVFGPMFQAVQVRGTIFVNTCNGTGEGIDKVNSFFSQNRVDKNKSGVNLSYGNFKKRVYPYELVFGDADPSRQTVTFVINAIGKPRKSS